ncbi:universal stress protein [Rhizobiales bacterium]|uniref:universal stress protein n=1 Tax=Hongsoonwoonella zoysiae TaxID=2821844 RepID=UPI00155F5F64|nr:universal stress protein [Hongsoonwoonella zoysiae]
MIKKVLIATDGSDHAKKAVAFGSDIASKYGADVVLVHVLLRGEVSEDLMRMAEVEQLTGEGGKPLSEAFASVPAGRFPADLTFTQEKPTVPYRVLEAVGEQVLDQAERIAKEHGAGKVKRRIEDGKPVDQVLNAVEAEGADLLVTGTRGLSNVKSMMVGSVSHKLSHMSPVTCISVR